MQALIVDDNIEAAQILADAARMVGCEQVETVDSGEDAIGKSIMADYDLISLDIRMPGVSGLDALSVIRGLRPPRDPGHRFRVRRRHRPGGPLGRRRGSLQAGVS